MNKLYNLYRTLSHILRHPFNKNQKFTALARFFKWQIGSYLLNYPVIYSLTDSSKLILRKSGATGNYYSGLDEPNDMGFLLHFLRPNDCFIDIGANIGSFSVLASAHCLAKSIAFEPVPSTYNYFQENIVINQIQALVTSYNLALGSEKGVVQFSKNLDSNHVVTKEENIESIDVEITLLDSLLTARETTLIKIDVEGFETEVINGAKKFLVSDFVKAIIIELNGAGNRYGYNEEKIHSYLVGIGFLPCEYDPFTRDLSPKHSLKNDNNNTIYVRDLNFVRQRLSTSDKICINKIQI